jgi:RNA polymerase sigma-70 factor, ECF subfamily
MNDSTESGLQDERAFVYAVIRRILRSDDDASDATQDALLLVHRHRGQFRGDSAFRTWLYRVAVTTALGALRKARRSREHLVAGDDLLGWAVEDLGPSPEQELSARQLAASATAQLTTLGEIYRDVFELKACDWAERDIANELGISVANVKIRTHRVRQHLRGGLDAWGVNPRASAAPRARRGSRVGTTATSRAS